MKLPNFLIIGAMRSGTTTIAHLLRDHPQVFMAERKELHFFDFEFDRGLAWYSSHFEPAHSEAAIGEATPNYMYFSDSLPRIDSALPEVRLVAILRNPIDRAYSHYWHNRSTGQESLDFAAALAAEPGRLASNDLRERAFWSYVDRGHYFAQLQSVQTRFGPERLLVLLFDDLIADPSRVALRLSGFLKIEQTVGVPEARNRFVSSRSRLLTRLTVRAPRPLKAGLRRLNTRAEGYPPMPASTRRDLAETFAAGNASLARFLGRDLGMWAE